MQEFIYQIMDAITVMHKFGITHGDIHLNNILKSNDGKLILADYGCSSFNTTIFYKDFLRLGLCFITLLRAHFKLEQKFLDHNLLIELRARGKTNYNLMEACDFADILLMCTNTTINKILMHSYLKRDAKMKSNHIIEQVDKKIPRKPLAVINVNISTESNNV